MEELWGKPLDVDLEAGLMNDNNVSAIAVPMLNTSEVARLDSAVPVSSTFHCQYVKIISFCHPGPVPSQLRSLGVGLAQQFVES